jgi:hypothetical protein
MYTLKIANIKTKLPKRTRPYLIALGEYLNQDFFPKWRELDKTDIAACDRMQDCLMSTIEQSYEKIQKCLSGKREELSLDRNRLRIELAGTDPAKVSTEPSRGVQ